MLQSTCQKGGGILIVGNKSQLIPQCALAVNAIMHMTSIHFKKCLCDHMVYIYTPSHDPTHQMAVTYLVCDVMFTNRLSHHSTQ